MTRPAEQAEALLAYLRNEGWDVEGRPGGASLWWVGGGYAVLWKGDTNVAVRARSHPDESEVDVPGGLANPTAVASALSDLRNAGWRCPRIPQSLDLYPRHAHAGESVVYKDEFVGVTDRQVGDRVYRVLYVWNDDLWEDLWGNFVDDVDPLTWVRQALADAAEHLAHQARVATRQAAATKAALTSLRSTP